MRRAVWVGAAVLGICLGCSDEALEPQEGGVVQPLGDYTAEVVPTADGRLHVHLRDAEGQAVRPSGVTLAAEVEDGEARRTVALLPDVGAPRYVGVVPGVTGRRPVKLVLMNTGTPEPQAEATFPDVDLTSTQVDANPWHNGQVSFVGDNRVEVAAAPDGQVTVSVTDLDGRPVPPEAVDIKTVRIATPSGPRVVPLKSQGPVYVGYLGAPPPPEFSATVDVGVRGRRYPDVRVRHVRPVAPGAVVQVSHRPPAPVVVHSRWAPPGPPSVEVHVGGPPPPPSVEVHVGGPPPPPSVEIHVGAPPPPAVEVHVGGHPGKGWAKGHYRGRGHGYGHPGKGWGKGHGRHGSRGHGRGHGKRGRW